MDRKQQKRGNAKKKKKTQKRKTTRDETIGAPLGYEYDWVVKTGKEHARRYISCTIPTAAAALVFSLVA